MEGRLREGSPEGAGDRETIGIMARATSLMLFSTLIHKQDAGVELNIPYYPLLRRNVDCIIALDASADSQDLWFSRAEAYATRFAFS
jgi:phospholipase A2